MHDLLGSCCIIMLVNAPYHPVPATYYIVTRSLPRHMKATFLL